MERREIYLQYNFLKKFVSSYLISKKKNSRIKSNNSNDNDNNNDIESKQN